MKKKKSLYGVIIIILFGFLAVSLAGNFILYRQGHWYYEQLNATRLDPIGLETFSSTSQKSPTAFIGEGQIVFVGDSRIAQWPQATITDHEIINLGIDAQTSAQVLLRYKTHISEFEPEIVLLQVGINDLKTLPLFPEQQEQIIGDLQQNIREINELALSHGATVILTTIFPVGVVPWEKKPFWSKEIESAIVEVNEFIKSLRRDDVIILDTYKILVGENGKIQPAYSYDLLHLNHAGYQLLNKEFEQLMITLFSL